MSEKTNNSGDWYCHNCGYLAGSRVNYDETCDTCGQPVVVHTADERSAVERLTAERDEAFDRGRAIGREDVGKYSRAIGEIEAALGIAGAVPLSQTVAAVSVMRAELTAAREALGEAWLAGGVTLTEGDEPAPGLLVCAGAGACGSVRCHHHGPHEPRPGCISVCHYDEECRPVCCVPVATTATAKAR